MDTGQHSYRTWALRKLSIYCEHQGTSPSRGHMGSGHYGFNLTSTSWLILKGKIPEERGSFLAWEIGRWCPSMFLLPTCSKPPLSLGPFQGGSRVHLWGCIPQVFLGTSLEECKTSPRLLVTSDTYMATKPSLLVGDQLYSHSQTSFDLV